jgi:16S rRNA (cytosine967-C5)-methyltransferase
VIGPARVAAFEILRALRSGRADLPTALASTRAALADARDQALAADIATGVQRWRAALDHVIAAFSKRPLERLDPEVVDILRLSLYQLLHLTRVPVSAAVDDAVDLVRRAKKTSAAGFVNAVLRSVSRQRTNLPLPPRPDDPLRGNAFGEADDPDRVAALAYLSITLSHPRWLVSRWLDRYGFAATERWLMFNNTPAAMTLRVNRLKVTVEALAARLDDEDVRVSHGRFAPDALIVEEGAALRTTAAAEGAFFVQEEASQLVALLASDRPGLRVLDACASPGGKTTAIAAATGGGLVVACDVRGRRMDLLRRTVLGSGATNVRLVQADLLQPLPFRAPFDCVLVDAPCSGVGTLRRDPDIRWRRREEDLPALAAAQRAMLGHAADQVAPAGRLIYATCSSEPEENDGVVDAFLGERPDFTPVDAHSIGSLPAAVVGTDGRFRTLPHVHGLEAFFGAVLQRQA